MWIDYGSDLLAPLAVTGDVHKERVYMLIQGVQEYIEGFCHRKFDLQEHDETGICGQDGSIILRNSPVQCITRLCFYNYGWLIIANTTAQVATFSTTHDGLNLMSIVNGVRSTFTLPYSLYPTMISLAGAINNMAGWSATVETGFELFPSSDLVATSFGTCTGQGAGGGGQGPATVPNWQDYVGSFDYQTNGIIYGLLPIALASGYQSPTAINLNMFRDFKWRILYTAGYEQIPADLKAVTANLTMSAYNGGRDVQTENLQGWSYTYFTSNEMAMNDKRILNKYRERMI